MKKIDSMKKKKVIAKFGNFEVTMEQGNGHDWLAVRAVTGIWTLRFRDDTSAFTFLTMLCKDENMRKYMECWVTANYAMTTSFPDMAYYEEFFKFFSAMEERKLACMNENSGSGKEEDDKIIKEMKTEWEMKQSSQNENPG